MKKIFILFLLIICVLFSPSHILAAPTPNLQPLTPSPTPNFIISDFQNSFKNYYKYVQQMFGNNTVNLPITINAQSGYEYEKAWTSKLLATINYKAPKFIELLSKANLVIYFGVDENGKPITVSSTSAHKMYMHNFDQSNEEGFDTILTHELSHVIDKNNDPTIDGRALLLKAVVADAGGNPANYANGLLTHYSRDLCLYDPSQRTKETQLGEDYAEMFAYYINSTTIESTACGSNGKNPYDNNAHPNHRSLVEHVLYGKELTF